MSGARSLRSLRIGLLAALAAMSLIVADSRAADPTGWSPLPDALRATLETGRPTLVIVTGPDAPSQQLRGALAGILQTQAVGGLVQLAEMPAAEHAERLRRMQVAVVPTALLYVRGEHGLALADYKQGMADPYQLVGWLSGVRLPSAVATAATPDTGIQRTGYPSPQAGPSPQAPPPPAYVPPPQPPVQAPPPPVYTQPVYVPPVVTAPAPAPAVVSPPSQTFVVQPQPATLVMAPAPQPNIILTGSAPSAPTISVASAPAPAPAAAPVNLITQPAAAPAPYAMAPAAAPTAYAMAPAPTYAQAPAVGQAPGVGQGPVTTALITMVAPSLFESLLGLIGNRLRRHSLPRMEMSQAPVVNTVPGVMAAPAPAAGYAPAPGYAPAYPQMGYMPVGPPYAPQGGYYAPPPPAPPYYPAPSPQGHTHGHAPAAPQKAGFFGH